MRTAAAFALALLAAPATLAADPRVAVDPNTAPWNAIAKVQTNTGMHCTGVLVAPAAVLTAAHCLFNTRTGALLRPLSVHVLFGYQQGAYRWHGIVKRIATGAGFDGDRRQPQPGDWARLDLAAAPRTTPLPLFEGAATPGMRLALAGYNQDRAEVLLADRDCRVLRTVERPGENRFVTHDCAATRGTSGAPLLIRDDGGWAVVGINIAAGPTTNVAISPTAAELQASKP